MTDLKDHTHVSSTELPDIAFPAVTAMCESIAEEHALAFLEKSDARLVLETVYGLYVLWPDDTGTRIEVRTDTLNALSILKDGLVQAIAHMSADTAEDIRWSDAMSDTGLPPNFQFTRAVSISSISPDFKRLRLSVPDLEDYTDSALHFRFALPDPTAPDEQWPRMKPNGAVSWPKGDRKLHTPVYTARAVDKAGGTLDVDIFLHQGGRATQWIGTLTPGGRVAIVGPGGGGIPQCETIHLFGDETAFPAIARILETLGGKASGTVTLLSADGIPCYPLPKAPDFRVSWLAHARKDEFIASALGTIGQLDGGYFWFAAEQTAAQTVRKTFKQSGAARERAYIATYWAR